MENPQFQISSGLDNLTGWQKAYCISVTIVVVVALLFFSFTAYDAYDSLPTDSIQWRSIFSSLESMVTSLICLSALFYFWKRNVYGLFHKIKILGFTKDEINYFYSINYTIEHSISFSAIESVTRKTKNHVELKFNVPVHHYQSTLDENNSVLPVMDFEVFGNEKEINKFIEVLEKRLIPLDHFPLGESFDKTRETALLIMGLASILISLFVLISWAKNYGK